MYAELYLFSLRLPQLLPQWSTIWATSPSTPMVHPDDICKVKRSCTSICAFASKISEKQQPFSKVHLPKQIRYFFVRCYTETYTRDESTRGPGKDEEQSRPIQELQRQIQVEIPVSTEKPWKGCIPVPFLPQSWKWKKLAPPWRLKSSSRHPFSTSMIVGERVYRVYPEISQAASIWLLESQVIGDVEGTKIDPIYLTIRVWCIGSHFVCVTILI